VVRLWKLATGLVLALCCFGGPAAADCIVIDRLDQLQIIQARLARDPDTALFATDIRQLRRLSTGLGDGDVLDAVDGNRFTGSGADFIGFLDDTQALLQRASLYDPQSVRPHFTAARRANLTTIRTHLHPLRCTDNDLSIARSSAASSTGAGGEGSDEEDLAEVADTLSALADEVFRIRTFVIVLTVVAAFVIIAPVLRNWLHLRRRKAKRHNTRHMTHYHWDSRVIQGMLVDINCYGAKLKHEKDNPLPVGSSVDIKIDEGDVTGTVMWSNTHYSGVQFRKSITLEAVAFVRARIDTLQKQNGVPRDAA